MPVAAGRMRNDWYPRRKADYMTESHLRASKLRDIPAERDFNFRPDLRAAIPEPLPTDNDGVIDMQAQLLAVCPQHQSLAPRQITNICKPQRSTDIISKLLPPILDFYRVPISTPSTGKPQETLTRNTGRAINTAASDLAAASEPIPEPAPVAIYGSVSTQDVISAVKAVLASDNDGVRVVLGPEDVSFVQATQSEDRSDTDRVKALGEFKVAITVKGGSTVSRTIRIHAQEAEP